MDRRKHLTLTPDVVVSKEPKEDSKPIDERLNPVIINSPVKQTKFKDKAMKSKNVDDIKRDQPLTSLSKDKMHKIKSTNELSQPRIKRRRVLSSAVHNNSCTTKELDTKFPFSPVYKRTRSFYKKTLPISNLTIQQKTSMQSSETG